MLSKESLIYTLELEKLQILPQGKASNRFKNGAYTAVREYFEPIRNAAIWQNMKFLVGLDEPIDQLPGNAYFRGDSRKPVF